MANEINNTSAAAFIPELWRPSMLEARFAKMKLGKRVLSVDGEVKNHGDILHIPVGPNVAVNNVGASGSVANQDLIATDVQLTVDKWKESTITVVDKAQKQSIVDLLTVFSKSFGEAIAEQIDLDLSALYSDVSTNTVGSTTTPEPSSEDMITAAIQKLLDLDVPIDNPENISFCFHTSQWPVLKKLPAFNHANLTGKSMGGALMVTLPELYGIPTYVTTVISATGSPSVRKNLLFHRQAFAFGMQKNFNIETFARTAKNTTISGDVLYGVKTVREDHACILNTAAS